MDSSKHFINQLKEKVLTEHGRAGDESFIIGLSGKWGQGKTYILDKLESEKKIQEKFEVIRIEPWKYGGDEVTFLRSFILSVSKLPHSKDIGRSIRNILNDKDVIRDLQQDVSRKNPHVGYILATLLYLIVWYMISAYVLPSSRNEFPRLIGLIEELAPYIPYAIIAASIQSLVTNQTSSKSVSTVDEFNNILDEYLKYVKKDILVFVDDLDRVTPEIAKRTLDHMRVFFNKPVITYVVTGDHTVLERYMGSQIVPRKESPDQLEEGRRYLKKIFNLYWRLPLLIDSELNTFIDSKLGEHKSKFSKIFLDENQLSVFHRYLRVYLERNRRQIIRFIDTVIFTFEIIDNQYKNASLDNEKYFKEMKENPLLVVRILMIQELCMPLFERVQEDSGVLKEVETAIDKKDIDGVDRILSQPEMTGTQKAFIRKFLNEEDRFYKDRMLVVQSIQPYLFLAAEAGFGDARGSSKEDFIEDLNLGDPKIIANRLNGFGIEKIQEAATEVKALLVKTPEAAARGQILYNLSSAMSLVGDDPSQKYFIEAIKDQDYSDIFGPTNLPKRLEISESFWRWMDTQDYKMVTDFLKQFPYVVADDFNNLMTNERGFGRFSSQVISSWLAHYYSVDPSPALEQMEKILPTLDKEATRDNSDVTIDALIGEILISGDVTRKNRIYDILCKYFPDCKIRLKNRIMSSIAGVNDEMWSWATEKVDNEYHIWNRQDLENAVIEAVVNSTTVQEFTTRLVYAQQKLTRDSSDQMWIRLNLEKPNLLDESFPNLIGSPIPQLMPPSKIAKAIFDRYLVLVKDDTNRLTSSLLYFKKDVWLWVQLNHLPHKKDFEKMVGSENQEIVDRSREVLTSWESVNKEAET